MFNVDVRLSNAYPLTFGVGCGCGGRIIGNVPSLCELPHPVNIKTDTNKNVKTADIFFLI